MTKEERELVETINKFLVTEDAQLFVQVTNLAPISLPKIWMRYFGADFMAEAKVIRGGNKRTRRITATGSTIAETMENLASNVASYLYPVEGNKV